VLNKFLIGDFLIGESRNKVANSKFKMNLTDKVFDDFGKKKKVKMIKEQEEFEMMKYGVVLSNMNQDNMEKNDRFYSKEIDLDTCRTALEKLKENNKVK
jgi:hypothetical protein